MATILIVEDEPPVRSFLAMFLEDLGHTVRTAINGMEALTQVASERPALVLTDVMMPVMGGHELCRRLKGDPDTAGIPIILMSAAAGNVMAGAGADAFIAKPIELDTVDALLHRWLPAL
jgi:CheY-like chemotaxis protein